MLSSINRGTTLASVLGKVAEHATSLGAALTKIFALRIASPPAHILMHFGPDAVEIGIAFLDGDCGDDRQDCRQREQPREAHLVCFYRSGCGDNAGKSWLAIRVTGKAG